MEPKWLVVLLVAIAMVAMAEGNAKPFKGAVPLRKASTTKHDHQDPTTQYLILGKDSDQNKRTQAMCYSQGNCFLKKLTCPQECPRRTAGKKGTSSTACFIDCSPSKCQTSCRSRKAKCHGFGAVCYDPRFVGGDGVMFYFHGKSNENFCLVTDPDLHINARFIGTRPQGRSRDYTWIQSLGIMFDDHQLSVSAAQIGGPWDPASDRIAITYDGRDVTIPVGEDSVWESSDLEVSVQRTDDINSALVVVNGLLQLDVNVVPITEQDNKVHNYQLDLGKDCFAHLDVQFKFLNLSHSVDGVLGQTYRPDFQNPVKVGVPMPVMGGHDKFYATSLFKPDCKVNLFHPKGRSTAQLASSNFGQEMKVLDCSSSSGGVGGLVCKR